MLIEFLLEWRDYGFKVAVYNAVFLWLHRNDDHVLSWRDDDTNEELIATVGHLGESVKELASILDQRNYEQTHDPDWL